MPAQTQTRQLPKLSTRAAFVPATLNEDNKTVELTWSTGAQVRRFDWWEEREWIEELSLDAAHVKLDRLNSGAPLLANHSNWSLTDVLGVVEKAWLQDGEGRAIVKFSERDDVAPIIADVKSGILRNISVGYTINKLERQPELQDGLPVYLAIDWSPMEISLVPIPADPGAQVRSESETHLVTIINKEDKSMAATAEEQTTETRGAAPAASVTTNTHIDETAIRADAAIKERSRVAEIRKFGQMARADESVITGFIERGDDVETAKSAMLKSWSERVDSETTRGDGSVVTDERDKFIEAGTQAIMARAGVAGIKMDGGNEFRGMRLTEVAKYCLERTGVPYRGLDEMTLVGRAFTQSTSDFPVLLENAMHKTLLASYEAVEVTWKRFCKTGTVTDFRAHNRYRKGSFGVLEPVNELGEFRNKSIPDGEKSSITADTKGNIINVSRKMVINDDLGAFVGLSEDLGMAAADTVEYDVYALLASNPVMSDGIALFHASHGNLAGSGSVVSMASVDAGRIAMGKQKDISGNRFLNIRPTVWLGSLAQGSNARTVNKAEYDPDTANKLQKPNTVIGLFRDIIDTAHISGNEWYFFADPSRAAVIEVAFLNGEQSPFLEMQEGFEVDGAKWKIRLDYGVAGQDYRGAYKNPGASS